MRNLRKVLETGSELQFVDPLNMKNKFRITLTRAEKQAGDIRVTNVRSEFVSTRQVIVPQGSNDYEASRTEALTVRVIISGSRESQAAVKQVVADTFAAVNISLDDHTTGFFMESPVYQIDVDTSAP